MQALKFPGSRLLYLVVCLAAFALGCENANLQNEPKKDILAYVDPFIGTGLHGHTFPGAVVPHGRVQLSPDTHLLGWDASSGYHDGDTTLYGFSHTHFSGTGIGDLGDILFLPFTGEFPLEKPVGFFSHLDESAGPGYYRVVVRPWNIRAELSATKRTGWHKYTFPGGKEACVMVDLSHLLQPDWGHHLVESELHLVDEYTLEGYRLTGGWAEQDRVWFRCVFDQPVVAHSLVTDGERVDGSTAEGTAVTAYVSFGKEIGELNARVSLSAVDAAGARYNMSELDHLKKLEDVVDQARQKWREELGVIQIETSDESVLTNFYTALYHTKIAPVLYSDVDGRYRSLDQQIHASSTGNHYTIYSLWDVFRSWYPLMTLIEPERARIWAYDLMDDFEKGGLLPKWPLNANYTGIMVGYPAVSILADAFSKGLIDSIPDRVIEASVMSSTWQQQFREEHKGTKAENVMPEQIYYKEKLGFVPADKCTRSVSYGLEMAYYDWCISRMAAMNGDKQLAMEYAEKGRAYRQYFDPELGFMRGKNADGSRDAQFNPRYSDHIRSEFVEGNAFQWTPFVPHVIDDFAHMLGGKAALGTWLDSLFTTSSRIEGENASADISGLIGQYAHGNEPDHHVPYIYQYSDRPWRSQEILDSILYDFYTPSPKGIIGNEDCGQMSAWYVLNAVGIYQVAPGKPLFNIGRPIVDAARIRVGDGWFNIRVGNNSRKNRYVGKVLLNGKALSGRTLSYSDFRDGGLLEVEMQEALPADHPDPVYTFARRRVEETRRQQVSEMPAWLKHNRELFRDSLTRVAREAFEQTGIWFLARGAGREKDEQETVAVWGDLLLFGGLETLPGYSRENLQQAVEFWQSWQNTRTGRLFNPLYQDPQHPEVKRETPGNRDDYSPDKINVKYIPSILKMLGAELPGPVNIATHADAGEDTFDELWEQISQWHTSPSGMFPVLAAREVEKGNRDQIPRAEAGMGALLRAYNHETGMWRPEPLEGFPWKAYEPSSGFKIISRICGYIGMENFPREVLEKSIDNLLDHKSELYAEVATARNYGETMAHYLMLTDYRHDELLDAMEGCLEGFHDPELWVETASSGYALFGSGMIGAFMNWKDLPFDRALQQWFRFEHGCTMKNRFVAGPYGNWVNVIPKEPQAIFGHPEYDVRRYGIKARNQAHWAKKITLLVPQQEVRLRLAADGETGEGTFTFTLTGEQFATMQEPCLKATWSGAYDISLNGEPVKQVRYNLPVATAGWYIPQPACKTLHTGENSITVRLIGPGKEPKPGAPLAERASFIRIGLIQWQ